MDYFKALLYSEISTRITANAAWFTDTNSAKAPAEIQYYTNQYNDQEKNSAFKRPAILIEFGEADIEPRIGLEKKALVPVIIHVVQDTYIKGRSGQPAAQKADFKDLLNYPYLVNALLDGWRGTCFNKLVLAGISPDHDVDNLYVERLRYTCEVIIKKGADVPE